MIFTRSFLSLTLLCGCTAGFSWGQSTAGPALFAPPAMDAIQSQNWHLFSEPWSPPTAQPGDSLPAASGGSNDASGVFEADDLSATEQSPLSPPILDALAAASEDDGVAVDDESSTWYEHAYWFGPAPWDTGIELGINGSSGTSESLSIRTGGYIKRESRFSKLDLSSYYNRTTDGGVATQNNAQLDVRNDWLLDDRSPWTLYGTSNIFYDEFQAFDVQASANTGVGYRFIHEPARSVVGRLGGGVSREIGGPDDRWVPESLVGFECSQHLFVTQKVYAKLDYYPELEQFDEYRLLADVGWEIELAQPSNLSLKISASDRYDSTPNGADPHLVNYSVLLLLRL